MCVPFVRFGSNAGFTAISYPEVVVQLVSAARDILVADHVDDAPVLDDVMTVGEGRGKVEILLDQQDREALLL
jgi:hypothetical protein